MARVLLIDDDHNLREVVGFMLGEAGHDVAAAGSAEDGLGRFARDPVDLVITDVRMPGRDGLHVLAEVAPTGTPVYAAGDGRVIKAGYTRANGNYVFIQHGEQYVTRYLHLHKRKVKQGQRVSQSQVIGTVGSTGAATGPHLHFELWKDGRPVNPLNYVDIAE